MSQTKMLLNEDLEYTQCMKDFLVILRHTHACYAPIDLRFAPAFRVSLLGVDMIEESGMATGSTLLNELCCSYLELQSTARSVDIVGLCLASGSSPFLS